MVTDIKIEVVNRYHGVTQGEYIGRGSPLGNPFSHLETAKIRPENRVQSRDEAVDRYRVWIQQKIESQDPYVLRELKRLRDKAIVDGHLKLVCFCAPKRCHGEIIRSILIHAIDMKTKDRQ